MRVLRTEASADVRRIFTARMEEGNENKRRGKRKVAPSFLPRRELGTTDAEGKKKRRYLTNEFLGKLNEAKQKNVVKKSVPQEEQAATPAPSAPKASRYRFAEGNRWVGAKEDDAVVPVYKVTPAEEPSAAVDVSHESTRPSNVRFSHLVL